MSGYNYNQWDGYGVPDMGANGLPLQLAGANVPTQSVSAPMVGRSTELHYSAWGAETRFQSPADDFKPAPKPVQPKLWQTIYRSVIGGHMKTGTNYSASGDYTSQAGSSLGGLAIPGASNSGNSGGSMSKLPATPSGPSTA